MKSPFLLELEIETKGKIIQFNGPCAPENTGLTLDGRRMGYRTNASGWSNCADAVFMALRGGVRGLTSFTLFVQSRVYEI